LRAAAGGTLASVAVPLLSGTAAAATTADVRPSDGFADVGTWLEDEDPGVYRIQEATRAAVEAAFQASGPRVVVFETSGTIDLGGETLAITEDQCWVAGQTAPSPGITFVRGMVQVDANDCVVQHVRSRIGPGSDGEIQGNDSLNTADGTANNVIDHVTASWGTDECLSVGYDTTDTTVTNCLVYEGLYDPYGDESDHNYGSLIGDGAENVLLAGNVWAKVRGRVPRLKTGTRSVVANNVMYFFNEATNLDGDTEAAIVGNVYVPQDVEDTPIEDGNAYLEDNLTDPSSTPLTGGTSELSSPPLWPSGFEALAASEVEGHGLSNAGARPADRTGNDARIVEEIRDRAGDDFLDSPYDYWIPDPSAVGGYPQLPENAHSLSVPDSGLRDWLTEWAAVVETGSGDPGSGGGGGGDDGSGDGDSGDGDSGDDGDDSGEPDQQRPYDGTPHAVPGRIQAEEFDSGGAGVAYSDTSAENEGGDFRTGEAVDVRERADGSGYNVGWIEAGEWLEYTVDVEQAGDYALEALVSSDLDGGAFHVEVGGTDVSGTVDVPDTGAWTTWETVSTTGVSLAAGRQVLRVVVDERWWELDYLDLSLDGAAGDGGDGGGDDDDGDGSGDSSSGGDDDGDGDGGSDGDDGGSDGDDGGSDGDDGGSEELIAELRPSTTSANVGERVTFEVADTSGDSHWITSLEWTFGDGTTATGWWNDHVYDAAGTYTVALTATDDTGTSTTHEITVTVA